LRPLLAPGTARASRAFGPVEETIMAKENDPDIIIIGRDDAQVTPDTREPRPGKARGHPLPSADNARHGSIPEHVEEERPRGSN
jgi:hypothetical protein